MSARRRQRAWAWPAALAGLALVLAAPGEALALTVLGAVAAVIVYAVRAARSGPQRPAAGPGHTWAAEAVSARREAAEARAALAAAIARADQADAARAELARQLAEARADAEAARESAALAWDAASSAAPRCRFCRRQLDADGACPAWCDDYPPEHEARARAELLADPRSGARPLGGAS
jgi:hypothetical protein